VADVVSVQKVTVASAEPDVKPTSSKLNTTPYAIASGSADATVTFWTDTTSARVRAVYPGG
jgi:U3 small nucleolar RNA-associated protein 13